MQTAPFCSAVIVAAGSSTRMCMKSCSKQFIPLLGVPAIAYTLTAFQKAEHIHEIIVVCREEDKEEMQEIIQQHAISKVSKLVSGGNTRQQSVSAGVAQISGSAAYIAVHDGARPLIHPKMIDAVVDDAFNNRASVLGIPIKDTIKRINQSGFIDFTPDRSVLWAVQTPQVFERGLYCQAMEQAVQEHGDYTDDCQLVEHIGVKVHICPGDYSNLKITTPEDVLFAEAILKNRKSVEKQIF